MDISIFTDKQREPSPSDLEQALGQTHPLWHDIAGFVREQYPAVVEEWNYPGAKYGWLFRMKDKKRAIIYLLPRRGYFKVAFVFGAKAAEMIMDSGIRPEIKQELADARVYAEGRGIRIDVTDGGIIPEIRMLINIKLAR